MPEFILEGRDAPEFETLPALVRGYIETMFFTSVCYGERFTIENWQDPETQDDVREGRSDGNLPSDAGFAQIHPDALAAIRRDCGTFHAKARHLLRVAYDRGEYDSEQAGRDLWYTRNGHGVGFWDRDPLRADGLGDKLSEHAVAIGEPHVWFADHVDHGNAPFVYHD